MGKIDIGIKIDLEKLISSRLLLQASSGGGKSYALRKIAEQLINHVQVIIVDIEGEFVSLREKYPFALVGKEGEIPLNIRYAETLAHKLLETNLSAVIDLSEMEVYQRRIFAKRFAQALIESPKSLWHPCVVIIDEADFFAPQGKESESTNAIVNLSSRGRKRGICPIYATQRIAKLHKDVTADVLNKIIGLTGQDVDQQRAGSELGFANKEDTRSLRKLQPGEFYAFGPAINNEVTKFKVSKVCTSHMEAGQYKKVLPPTPNAIKKILGKLSDIPEEAEKELNTKKELEAEVKRLTAELKKKAAPASVVNKGLSVRDAEDLTKRAIQPLVQEINERKKKYNELVLIMAKRNTLTQKAVDTLNETLGIVYPKEIISKPTSSKGLPLPADFIDPKNIKAVMSSGQTRSIIPVSNGSISSGSGEMRMLKAAAMFHPNPISRTRMGAFARLSHTSGSFGTYISKLRQLGYIIGGPAQFEITSDGLVAAGDVPALPTDPYELINLWVGIIGENTGAARMLRVLGDHSPNEMTREELGAAVSMNSTSGSFGTYLSYLRARGLIVTVGKSIKASDELFL